MKSGLHYAIKFMKSTDFYDEVETGELGLKRKLDKSDNAEKPNKKQKKKDLVDTMGIGMFAITNAAAGSSSSSNMAANTGEGLKPLHAWELPTPDELKDLGPYSFTRDDVGKLKLRLYVKVFLCS